MLPIDATRLRSRSLRPQSPVFPRPPQRRPPSSRPLFLDSDSDDDGQTAPASRYASKSTSKNAEIDAFFADLDDDPDTHFQDLAPSLDLAALKRQANAKLALTPHQILPSSSPPRDLGDERPGPKARQGDRRDKDRDEPITKRKKRPRLDEARLVGPDGFPALVKQTKDFRPKGKGHELQDLNRLMNVYQFWAHKLYPNTQFSDTVERVEKLCHSKRMNVALSVWRDEAKGLIHGQKIPGADDDPLFSDENSDAENDVAPRAADGPRSATHEPETSVPVATDNERGSSPGRSLPPSSPSSGTSSLGALDDDFDIDAMIREDEAVRAAAPAPATTQMTAAAAAATSTSRYGVPKDGAGADDDEDAAMWDAVMDDFPAEPYVPPQPRPQPPATGVTAGAAAEDEMDEDMWDVVREMEAEPAAGLTGTAASLPSAGSGGAGGSPPEPGPSEEEEEEAGSPAGAAASVAGVDPSRKASNAEGWDEMYA
ncbi:replication fork protection component Swi3-domain-containing protein [Trametes gibbosa]|nr:replication fork protection component Swi3-domain-containing protein [Trametes gibbosa]